MMAWRPVGEAALVGADDDPGDEAAAGSEPDQDSRDQDSRDQDSRGEAEGRSRVRKAAGAFRTISEVADELHIPQHVLRFWETRFPQVKPLKRGGGRRYYRPDDIALLRRISELLYIQGYTIKGVQRLLREGGGRLADNIPPAPEAERVAAEAERTLPEPAQMQLLMPEAAIPPVPRRPTEAERLRLALVRMLNQLEDMRAMLP
jgi:DNA-binding transcriptional MerR regulator